MSHSEQYYCRVCGYESDCSSWGEDGNSPDFTFCPCCGVEAGYGDITPDAARAWRNRWLEQGAKWDDEIFRPHGWILEKQLQNVPSEFQ
jgi:hypothetical protein